MSDAIQYSYRNDVDDINPPVDNTQQARLLQKAGIQGEQKRLNSVAADFDNDTLTLNLLAAYLNRWHRGRLDGLDTIPILLDCDYDRRGLRRMLAAFESTLCETPDMTLLYLLSLSDRPVTHQHMQEVFSGTLLERWLPKRDDYARFLAPLKKLNEKHWQWVIENLRELKLLETPTTEQHDLLVIADPVRDYFRSNLQLSNQVIFTRGTADMNKLPEDSVTHFRHPPQSAPEPSPRIFPEPIKVPDVKAKIRQKPPAQPQEKKPIRWKQEELVAAQQQLLSLRHSLDTLKSHTGKLAQHLAQPNPADKKSRPTH